MSRNFCAAHKDVNCAKAADRYELKALPSRTRPLRSRLLTDCFCHAATPVSQKHRGKHVRHQGGGQSRRRNPPSWQSARQCHRLRIRRPRYQLRRFRSAHQSRRQRPRRARRQTGRAHRLSRQEQRHLFRAAVGRHEGRCGHGAGQLAAGWPGDRFHRRGLQGAGAVRRTGVRRTGADHPSAAAGRADLRHHRRWRAGLAGLPGVAGRAKQRRSERGDQRG